MERRATIAAAVVVGAACLAAGWWLLGRSRDETGSPGSADARENPASGATPVLETDATTGRPRRIGPAAPEVPGTDVVPRAATDATDRGAFDPQRLPGAKQRIALTVGTDEGEPAPTWHPNWSLPHGTRPEGKPFRLSADGTRWSLAGLSAASRWVTAALLEDERVLALSRPTRVGSDGTIAELEWIPRGRLATLRLPWPAYIDFRFVTHRVRWGEAEIGPVQLLPVGELLWMVPAETDLEVSIADWSRDELPLPAPVTVRLAPGEERRVQLEPAGARLARVHAVDASGKRQPGFLCVWRLDGAQGPGPWCGSPFGVVEESLASFVPGRYGISVRTAEGSGWREIDVGPGFEEGTHVDVLVEPGGRRLRVLFRPEDVATSSGTWAVVRSLDAARPRDWYSGHHPIQSSGLLETAPLPPGTYLVSLGGHAMRLRNDREGGAPLALPRLPPTWPIYPSGAPEVRVTIRALPLRRATAPGPVFLERTEHPDAWGYLSDEGRFRPVEPGAWRVLLPATWWWPVPHEGAEGSVIVGPKGSHPVDLQVTLQR